MKAFVRVLTLSGCTALLLAGYTNGSFVLQTSIETAPPPPLASRAAAAAVGEPKMIMIGGKLYEENSRGVYNVDGVATFAKRAPKRVEPRPGAVNPSPGKTQLNLGPPIDPSIYREAIGFDDSELFSPGAAGASGTE